MLKKSFVRRAPEIWQLPAEKEDYEIRSPSSIRTDTTYD